MDNDVDRDLLSKENAEVDIRGSEKLAKYWFVIVTLFLVVLFILFGNDFGIDLISKFSDSLNGLLTPFFSLLAFLALLKTVVIQSRELKLSRNEVAESRVEMKRTADEQSKANKIHSLGNQIQIINTLIEYQGTQVTNVGNQSYSVETYNSGWSKKDLLNELLRLRLELKGLIS